jgi:hypothetical protein
LSPDKIIFGKILQEVLEKEESDRLLARSSESTEVHKHQFEEKERHNKELLIHTEKQTRVLFDQYLKNHDLFHKKKSQSYAAHTRKKYLLDYLEEGKAQLYDHRERVKQIKDSCKSNNLPNVYLLHGEFSDEEINEIYNHSKVKAMVNLTKGEGFGRPLLEFSLVNKPIITTNWSGHTDYLNPEFVTLLSGTMTNVHESSANHMLMKEAEWFSVDYGQTGYHLKDMFENYKGYAENAKRQGFQSRTKFSFEAMKIKLDEVFTNRIPDFPKQVQLQLPKLKKIELPKLKKID